MNRSSSINELQTSLFLCRPSGLMSAITALEKAVKADVKPLSIDKVMACTTTGETQYSSITNEQYTNPYDYFESNSIAVIPIIGMMTKYGTWYSYGSEQICNYIQLANDSKKISAIVLRLDTPGGTVTSIFNFVNIIPALTKTCCAFIDGQCCSAGIYIASLCDSIHASHDMCEVGSIGAMGRLVNSKKAEEKYGYEMIDMYPKESEDKNKEVREALNGNTSLYEDNILSPLAQDFQNAIRVNRTQLDESVPGILSGKVFFAKDAITYGLIDGIKSLTQLVAELQKDNSLKNDIKSVLQ